MPDHGQTAYESYIQALDVAAICTWHDLSTDMQRVWAVVEVACQGHRLLPFHNQAPNGTPPHVAPPVEGRAT
jgi:hypothetical protein